LLQAIIFNEKRPYIEIKTKTRPAKKDENRQNEREEKEKGVVIKLKKFSCS
jgi:hypothetical protein